jgi:hypothetical protein
MGLPPGEGPKSDALHPPYHVCREALRGFGSNTHHARLQPKNLNSLSVEQSPVMRPAAKTFYELLKGFKGKKDRL